MMDGQIEIDVLHVMMDGQIEIDVIPCSEVLFAHPYG